MHIMTNINNIKYIGCLTEFTDTDERWYFKVYNDKDCQELYDYGFIYCYDLPEKDVDNYHKAEQFIAKEYYPHLILVNNGRKITKEI